MNYINKLFAQHPFIYHIGEKYYAFGNYTCYECDMRSVTLKSRYEEYRQSINEEISDREAWKIFHRLVFNAECVRNEKGYCSRPQEEIEKFEFNDKEMQELNKQIDDYISYYKKHSLSSFG